MTDKHNLFKNALLVAGMLVVLPVADFLLVYVEPLLRPRFSMNATSAIMTGILLAIILMLVFTLKFYIKSIHAEIAIPAKVFYILLFVVNYLVAALMSLVTLLSWGRSGFG